MLLEPRKAETSCQIPDRIPEILDNLIRNSINELLYTKVFDDDEEMMGLTPEEASVLDSIKKRLADLKSQKR